MSLGKCIVVAVSNEQVNIQNPPHTMPTKPSHTPNPHQSFTQSPRQPQAPPIPHPATRACNLRYHKPTRAPARSTFPTGKSGNPDSESHGALVSGKLVARSRWGVHGRRRRKQCVCGATALWMDADDGAWGGWIRQCVSWSDICWRQSSVRIPLDGPYGLPRHSHKPDPDCPPPKSYIPIAAKDPATRSPRPNPSTHLVTFPVLRNKTRLPYRPKEVKRHFKREPDTKRTSASGARSGGARAG
jgi:hypothetical protein